MVADNPQQQPTKKQPTTKKPTGKYVFEVDCKNNRTYLSPTFQEKWRSAFSLNKIGRGHNVGDIMANMRDIPGLRIEVDIRAATVKISDPLTTKQCEAIDKVRNNPNAGPMRTDGKTAPVETKEHDLSKDADTFKTFLIEVCESLEQEYFKLLSGGTRFLTREEIDLLPGLQLNDPHNSSALKPKYARDQQEWMEQLQARNS